MIVTSMISPSLKQGLQLLGVWPDTPYAMVNRLACVSSILIVQYFQYLYVFTHCKPSELPNLMDSLPPAFDYSLTIMKLTGLWMNHRVMRKILVHMDADWRECVNIDRDLQVMTTNANISHFGTNAMTRFFMFVSVMYFAGDYAIGIVSLYKNDNDTTRPFPMKLMFPFDAQQSPIYELLVVVLFLYTMLHSYTIALLDALIFSLVFHVSGQIDIMCRELKTTSEKVSYYRQSDHTIGMLITRHNKIISFSKNLDKLFSFMALMQIFWNTLVICSLGLLIMSSVHTNSAGMIKTVFAYGAVMMEVFIFCFAGEYINFKSRSLASAAYESLWYNMSPNMSKNILFVIMRSQKQLSITAGGMTNLSLEVFTSIIKTSASYASVLHAMY